MDNSEFLYHYTTIPALNGILNNHGLIFWGTRYDQMNDPMDYKFALEFLHPKILEMIETKCIEKYKGISDLELSPYIVSFSFLEDNLTMWRFYNSKICIVLDMNRLVDDCKKHLYDYAKCKYCTEDKDEIKKAMLDISKGMDNSATNVLEKARKCYAFIKHHDYKNEQEFRVVQFDHSTYNINDADAFEVKVKPMSEYDLILYKNFYFSKKTLRGIIINEPNEKRFQSLKSHLEIILRTREYDLKDMFIKQTKTAFNYSS